MYEIIINRIAALYEAERIGDEQLAAYVAAGLITAERSVELRGATI